MAETLRAVADGNAEAEPRWYACYTKARHEKRVETLLRERGIETFLPLITRESQWKDRKKVVDWPLFPSYVFGRFTLADVHRVLSVPGVATLVKANGRPVWIEESELENVRLFAQALAQGGKKPEPRPYFADGEWVEVMDGPFRGVRGIVVEQRGRRRVLIGLKAIGQGLEVDIDTSTLRSIGTS
ncbi:MAG TPA: UpxY family transcription antiterminator [Longimicrobiales bacterium]|nr:UpxY family transcription antiterminator [Longimicrobiales bacterium]